MILVFTAVGLPTEQISLIYTIDWFLLVLFHSRLIPYPLLPLQFTTSLNICLDSSERKLTTRSDDRPTFQPQARSCSAFVHVGKIIAMISKNVPLLIKDG